MTQITSFTFNDFQENTYIVFDETKECVIIDPGCYSPQEKDELAKFIDDMKLNPVKLLNTHCHIDHIFGNKFVADKYNLELETHKGEIIVLDFGKTYAQSYGYFAYEPSPEPTVFWNEGDTVSFGNTEMSVLFTPGHSPASICLYCEKEKYIVSGDVLFQGGIGRFDLPGGNRDTLMKSIIDKLMPLPDDVQVYSGHGPATTIGFERQHNPYIQMWERGEAF